MRADRVSSRLRARYARIEARVCAPEMSLAARPVPVTLRTVHHHTTALQWAPRLHLQLQDGARGGWPRTAIEATTRATERRQRLETTLRRIVARTERVEEPSRPEAATLGLGAAAQPHERPATAPSGAAPARVFQKPARERTPAPPAPAPAATDSGAATTVSRWPGWPPARNAAAAPPIDVERLTDQVMNTIGRRMAAHRERRGR